MKVYGIFTGCIYEGGGVKPTIYMNKQDAIQSLDEFVNDYNSQWEEGDDMRLIEKGDYFYDNGCDVICMQEFELI